ncbi:MAG: META domain-containing protein [Actinomycetota bacterium]|nr:META domain-containing protein [Actinomycetota bacterium]
MRARLATFVGVAAALGLLVAACGDDSSPSTSTSLSGHSYLATSAEGFELPAGSALRLAFDGFSVRMSGGCNSGSADYEIVDGLLQMDSMSMTEMACDQPLMDLDAAVAGLLGAKPVVKLTGEVLTITSGAVSLTLTESSIANPDRPLEGTRWVVTSVLAGDSVSSVPGTAEAALRIVDGRVEVNAGCNSGSAQVAIEPTAIDFGPLRLTKMACADDAMQLEAAVVAVLQGSVSYEIEGAQLTLLTGERGLLLSADES